MFESKEVVLSGVTFTITALDAVAGRRMLARLVSAAGPAIKGADLDSSGMQAVASLLGGACERLSPELVDDLCVAFAAKTTVSIEGKNPELSGIFQAFFSRKYKLMTEWLGACLEYNFADFLDGGSLTATLKKLLAKPAANAPQATESAPQNT